ncbi:DUF4296 domain-containing protein [Pontibacter saemangeumensis]
MKRLFCILFCLCLLSCQQQNEDKPENMIPQQKMVRILADIHTAEAQLERNVSYPDTALVMFADQQTDILKKHGVGKQAFKDTYRYYLTHLEEMDKLYEMIVDSLSVRESKAEAIKAKTDTTKAVRIIKKQPGATGTE